MKRRGLARRLLDLAAALWGLAAMTWALRNEEAEPWNE